MQSVPMTRNGRIITIREKKGGWKVHRSYAQLQAIKGF